MPETVAWIVISLYGVAFLVLIIVAIELFLLRRDIKG